MNDEPREPNRDSKPAAAAAAGLSAIGVATGGAAGVAFLLEPIDVPLWFVLAAVSLPSGDLLALLRGMIARRRKRVKPESE